MLLTLDPQTVSTINPSEQLLRDLVFAVNGFHLPAQATFGYPKALTPVTGDPTENDTAILVSMPQGLYGADTGSKWLYYRRMDLGRLTPVNISGILMTPGTVFSLTSILSQINSLYGVNLSVTDIIDASYVAGSGPYTMQASSGSLAWEGQVNIDVVVDIGAVTPITALSGFDPATMMMSMADLSGFKDEAPV
jgi:hypothetical protein